MYRTGTQLAYLKRLTSCEQMIEVPTYVWRVRTQIEDALENALHCADPLADGDPSS
jgi:hypothetical protein